METTKSLDIRVLDVLIGYGVPVKFGQIDQECQSADLPTFLRSDIRNAIGRLSRAGRIRHIRNRGWVCASPVTT